MNKSNIVKGYNGIMDLDLNLVSKIYHKEAVKQHYLDIENYKKEQSLLPENLRYENTVIKAQNIYNSDQLALKKRSLEKEKKWYEPS
tara:strand:- start:93 stop:353 length:261 start_codon:yes stop_codon:yes gene_type:complete